MNEASPPPGPDNQTVQQHLLDAERRCQGRAVLRTVLHTNEGRPIDALTLTDPNVPDDDKQHVLIVAGQHGNEETARLIAIEAIDYLLGSEGREILKHQKVVVLPNLSPDAAARDEYDTPQGVRPNLDHGPNGPVSNEAKALEMVAKELQPDVYVDIHAMGHTGCSYDMVLFAGSRQYLEDEMILHQIAQQMAAEGERSGIPQVVHPLTWVGWGGNDLNEPSSTLWMYRQFKSLVFLLESSEANSMSNPRDMQIASGVGRLKALLTLGNQRHPKLYYPGYPCYLTTGMFNKGIVAVGRTAAERRRSRIGIWKNTAAFKQVKPKIPEAFYRKTLLVDYQGEPISTGIGFQIRAAGQLELTHVTVDGRPLMPGETEGYYTWHDGQITSAVAAVSSLEPGQHEINYTFSEK